MKILFENYVNGQDDNYMENKNNALFRKAIIYVEEIFTST